MRIAVQVKNIVNAKSRGNVLVKGLCSRLIIAYYETIIQIPKQVYFKIARD